MIELIKRRAPGMAEMFTTERINGREGKGVYEIEADGGKVALRGSDNIAIAMAFYRYLRDFCGAPLSQGTAGFVFEETKAALPAEKITFLIEQEKRMCLSYETYANDACRWGWERWETELDFMAMNGVNMPLCLVGYEAVWYYTMLKLKINREDSLNFLSSVCYYPQQLEGRLDSFLPLTDTDFLKARIELGSKILARARELGMSPVTQGFTGHVPKLLKGYFKKAEITPVTQFYKFSNTFRLLPSDPLFEKIGAALYEKQRELFGESEYYICNPFSSVTPLVRGEGFLKSFGSAIYSLIDRHADGAVWVLDASSYSKPLVSGVPEGRVVIVDTDGTACESHKGFGGLAFVLGTRFNNGGRTTLHGSVKALADNPYARIKSKYKNVVGTGVFQGATGANPLYGDLAFQMLSESGKIDVDRWLGGYVRRRWGSVEKCLKDAALMLCSSCYSENCRGAETGSIIAARPSTELAHTAPGDTLELRYENKELCAALELMLSSKAERTDGFVFDVCDILRQVMSNYARRLYADVMKGYTDRDVRLFETSTNAFLKLLEEQDGLLNTMPEFRLSEYLRRASDAAISRADSQNFELAFLCFITMYGPFDEPEYYDTAWREWADLVGGYYYCRWRAFFEMLAASFKRKGDVSTVTRKQTNGRNITRGNSFYKKLDAQERKWITKYRPSDPSDGDTLKEARKLLNKYSKLISGDQI